MRQMQVFIALAMMWLCAWMPGRMWQRIWQLAAVVFANSNFCMAHVLQRRHPWPLTLSRWWLLVSVLVFVAGAAVAGAAEGPDNSAG